MKLLRAKSVPLCYCSSEQPLLLITCASVAGLVAFTDGGTEALNPAEEEFGEDRLKELLRRAAHLPVEEMSAEIARELRAWIANAAQYDDLTFIVMKVN